VRGLKDTVRTAALGVDDALGDALAVEVREQVDVCGVPSAPNASDSDAALTVEVLQQQRAADVFLAVRDALRLVRLREGRAVGRRVGDLRE
jgi:hypothetical protein